MKIKLVKRILFLGFAVLALSPLHSDKEYSGGAIDTVDINFVENNKTS